MHRNGRKNPNYAGLMTFKSVEEMESVDLMIFQYRLINFNERLVLGDRCGLNGLINCWRESERIREYICNGEVALKTSGGHQIARIEPKEHVRVFNRLCKLGLHEITNAIWVKNKMLREFYTKLSGGLNHEGALPNKKEQAAIKQFDSGGQSPNATPFSALTQAVFLQAEAKRRSFSLSGDEQTEDELNMSSGLDCN